MYYIRIALTLFAMMFSAVSLAENASRNYIGVNLATFDSKYHTTEQDGYMVNLGFDMNNYFAFELAAGTSKTETDPVTNDTSKIDYTASAFLRFNMRFDRITVYLLGGYSQVEGTTTSGGVNTSTTDEGGSYGYGLDFYGTRDLALSFRRVEFFDNEETTGNRHLGATTIGITYYYDTPKIRSRY